jgi:hypothetical protein
MEEEIGSYFIPVPICSAEEEAMMVLTTPTQTEELEIQSTAPTAVEPGDTFSVELIITVHRRVRWLGLDWTTPEGVTAVGTSLDLDHGGDFRVDTELEPDVPIKVSFAFATTPDARTFGRITGTLRYSPSPYDGAECSASWSSCIAVYARAVASDQVRLSDELRDRLITAVNFDSKNGHAFLMDYCAFFNDFCHVEVPETIAGVIAEDLGLSDEGIPTQKEHYVGAILGERRVYGVEKLELIAEEDCAASDSRFDLQAARDVPEGFLEVGHD